MIGLGFLNKENYTQIPEAKLALPEDLETPRADVIAKTVVLFHDIPSGTLKTIICSF